ncbi:MAG: ClbS/DfsB family four-helix bundle protein, partial [Chloroflexi bacterium]|nr:ClbS/DfsB family four-helix bundle protein [Chloroflexota bacterium]
MTNSTLIADLHHEQAQWQALLDQIGEARMDQPDVAGGWSIKDIVAHLTGWRKRTVARLQAAQRGEDDFAVPWPTHLQTDDEINAWLYEANRDRSVREVLDDSQEVFQQMVAAIEAFPEAELLDPQRFPWMEGKLLTAEELFG